MLSNAGPLVEIIIAREGGGGGEGREEGREGSGVGVEDRRREYLEIDREDIKKRGGRDERDHRRGGCGRSEQKRLVSPHNVTTERTISESGNKQVRNFLYLPTVLDDDQMTAVTGEDSDHPVLREGRGKWQ